MIVNLAAVTLNILNNANLSIESISHVAYYNVDEEEMQVCTFQEFIEVAEDINYDEMDPMFSGRRIVSGSIQIVGDTWWLRRTTDNEDTEEWVYCDLPIPLEELENGEGDLHRDYIINPIDAHDEDYVELVEHVSDNYTYAKPDTVKLNGVTYNVVEEDGVSKVIDGEYVLMVIAAGEDDTYFTTNDVTSTNINLLFEPALVKLAFECKDNYMCLSDTMIHLLTGMKNAGFGEEHYAAIKVIKVRRGVKFVINMVNRYEHVEYLDSVQWIDG